MPQGSGPWLPRQTTDYLEDGAMSFHVYNDETLLRMTRSIMGDDTRPELEIHAAMAEIRHRGLTDQLPAGGDVVTISPDNKYYAVRGEPMRGVVDPVDRYGDDLAMVTLSPRVFWGDYISISGGPCPPVPRGQLRFAGKTQIRVWRWNKYGRGRGNGEDYVRTVNSWTVEGELTDA